MDFLQAVDLRVSARDAPFMRECCLADEAGAGAGVRAVGSGLGVEGFCIPLTLGVLVNPSACS